MMHQTSMETGFKSFNHDKTRGRWESPNDFLFACVGHAFKLDVVGCLSLLLFSKNGVYFSILVYVVTLALYIVPIILVQSFYGQFSSTGFISVFRVAPICKGIGYVSLAFNFITLVNYSVMSSIPVLYFWHSLNPTLPWSCEGVGQWMEYNTTVCNGNGKVPSDQFYRYQLSLSDYGPGGQTIYSVPLMFCLWTVWLVVTFVSLQGTETVGRFMRLSFRIFLGLLCLCILRFIFLPGVFISFIKLLVPFGSQNDAVVWLQKDASISIPSIAVSTFGPGWGSILTMASFNEFKTDIFRNSWIISLVHLGVVIGMAFLLVFLKLTLNSSYPTAAYWDPSEWTLLLLYPTVLATLELPNFWCLIFFGVLMLGSLNLVVIQFLSFMTSLFDEFESLRKVKSYATIVIVFLIAMFGSFLCSNFGMVTCQILVKLNVLAQIIMDLLLLIVIYFVHDYFKRDLEFMTSKMLSKWNSLILVICTPTIMTIQFIIGLLWLFLVLYAHPVSWSLLMLSLCLFTFIWILIPVGCISGITSIPGDTWTRLKNSVEPTYWHPADPDYKQCYEELLNKNYVQSLNVTEEVNV